MLDWKKPYFKFILAVTLNATIYISYRLYVHKLKNQINKIDSENEELIKKLKLDLHPVLIKNFGNYEILLNKFKFVELKDDLAELKIALFDYKGYTFALRKYDIHNRPEYTLLAETSKMIKDGLISENLCNEFIAKMKLTKVPTVWKSQYYKNLEEEKAEIKPKVRRRIRIKIEKEIKVPKEKKKIIEKR